MKRIGLLLGTITVLFGCENYSARYQQSQVELSQARDSIKMLISTIDALSYPANQRLSSVKSHITKGDYDSASSELRQLVSLFPNSPEAKQEAALRAQIQKGVDDKLNEYKRIQALGFKALKDSPTVYSENVKATFSNVGIGSTFVYDNYGYEYCYRKADKNCKYVTAAMSITSEDNNPKLPQCALYVVDGQNLVFETTLITRFARWDDYGSYLGNYADYNNDFSKVNTVKFKVGAEISDDKNKRPFVLIIKKENVLTRTRNSYAHPEISYEGHTEFRSTLTIDDFNNQYCKYAVIKRFNFDQL